MGLGLQYEDFDQDATAQDTDRGYAAGFEDGLRAATDQAANRQAVALEDIVQTLSDWDFGFAEAQGALIARLGPLFDAISEKIVPDSLQDTYGARLSDLLDCAAREALDAAPKFWVSANDPIALDRIRDECAARGMSAEFAGDDMLGPGALRWAVGDKDTMFDPAQITEGLREILEAVIDEPERKARNV